MRIGAYHRQTGAYACGARHERQRKLANGKVVPSGCVNVATGRRLTRNIKWDVIWYDDTRLGRRIAGAEK